MLVRIMVGSIMNAKKLSTIPHGLNNFSIRNEKKKLYKVHLSRRRKKKKNKKQNQFSQVQTWRLRMKL